MAGFSCLWLFLSFGQAEGGEPAPTSTTGIELLDEESIRLDASPAELEDAGINPGPSVGVWDFFRMLLVLLLVVVAMYGIYFLIRKGNKPVAPDSAIIKVLSTQTLSPGKQLHVVEIGKTMMVIGSADQGINLISTIDDKESQDEIRLEASKDGGEKKSFADLLGSMLQQAPRERPNKKGNTP